MRSHLIKALCGLPLTSLSLLSFNASAAWPEADKPVHLIVPAPGGAGTADTIARLIADKLSTKLDANVIVENRGGANGNIGAAAAAKAKPDGYSLLFSWAGTLAVSPHIYKNPGFSPMTDFEPIGLVAEVPNILVVNNKLPVKTLAEFIEYARAHPGELNFGSSGNGSSMHIAGEFFMRETGTKLVHIPYSAPGQATTNLMANDIQVMFQLVPGIIGQVKAQQVRPLALLSRQPSPSLPDVPTTAALGHPQLLSSTWFALLAPRGTPEAITTRVNTALNEVLKDPAIIEKLGSMGATTLGGSRQELASYMDEELQKWGRVLRQVEVAVK